MLEVGRTLHLPGVEPVPQQRDRMAAQGEADRRVVRRDLPPLARRPQVDAASLMDLVGTPDRGLMNSLLARGPILDYNNLSKLTPEDIAERRKEFDVVKAVIKTKQAGG